MADSSNTVGLHRVLRAPAEHIYRAFLDPAARERWLPPYGFLGKVHESNESIYGNYRMSFTNFGTGEIHSFSGKYIELSPHQRIRYIDTFDDPNLPGEIHVTVILREVLCGTELQIVQEGIPAAIPSEMCYLGWQESLLQLANLVESTVANAE
jgi:uncharacterized protein YndB with AHSA1/START domain